MTPKYHDAYVSVRAQNACMFCGHPRRVHVVTRWNTSKTDRKALEWGKCLGGTAFQPMSCDCKDYAA